MKKKEHFAKHSVVYEVLLQLQRIVDDLVDFLELPMFINTSLSWLYYLMKWMGDLDIKKLIGPLAVAGKVL